ncbi:hypothetical protein C1703_22870 [Streptomyces sp. Go-475]|nr:hypothetical protein C1703_22870 [Streptomyces sp. Go-475]
MPRRPTSSSTGTTAPRNRTPQPVRVRQRSFGDVVKAFLAFVALLVLLVGVPFALVPSLDWLQQEITVQTFLNILTVVVWLAWAQFTACVLVEMKAALSGAGVPGRVPGAGPSQLSARPLVGADPEGGRLLDRSPRGLAASLAAESRARPVVHAAWLSNGDLRLQLAQPAGKPPAPWQQGQDQIFRVLGRADAERYGDADTAAPYPGLVSLGTMDDSRLLLDLEAVPGTETGDPDRLAALATDLIGRSGARGLPPRTEALLDELLPTWRDTIAAAG